MGAQFAHIQTVSRKRNRAGQCVDQVIGELQREALYSAHVPEPAPPEVVDGISPEQLRAAHDAMIRAAETQYRLNGEVKTRAVRQDRHTLVTAVASYPVPYDEIRGDPEQEKALKEWEDTNVRFFRKLFGKHYRATYRHVDETYPHLHIYALPENVPGIDAQLLHPGKAARKTVEAECKAAGMSPREAVKAGNRALKSAMRDWQDLYYRDVGEPCGLLRDGPRRLRLSRAQYKARQSEARLRSRSSLEQGRVELVKATRAALEEAEIVRESARQVQEQQKALAARDAALEERAANLRRREERLDTEIRIIRETRARVSRIVELIAAFIGLENAASIQTSLSEMERLAQGIENGDVDQMIADATAPPSYTSESQIGVAMQ